MELGLKPKEAGLCVLRLITWGCYHFSAPFSERPQECSGKMGQAVGHTSVLVFSPAHEPLIWSTCSPASPAQAGPTTGSGINRFYALYRHYMANKACSFGLQPGSDLLLLMGIFPGYNIVRLLIPTSEPRLKRKCHSTRSGQGSLKRKAC